MFYISLLSKSIEMKKIFYFVLTCVSALSIGSCGLLGETNTENDSDSLALDSIALGDFEFKTRHVAFKDSLEQNGVMVFYDVDLDVPVSGPVRLVSTVRKWIDDKLGGSYEKGLNFDNDMLLYYANSYFQDCEDKGLFVGTGASFTLKVSVVANTANFVSYVADGYDYTGGAHGLPFTIGATFVKDNGKTLGWDIFADTTELAPLFKDGVATYFTSVNANDSTLKHMSVDEFLFDDAKKSFPLPVTTPWLVDSGVSFIYGAYEIAPYAAGMPQATIPTAVAEKYLSDKAKKLLKKDVE